MIGHDSGTLFVVAPSGTVMSTGGASAGARFVNSTEEMFHDSLTALRAAWETRSQLSDTDAIDQAMRLGKTISEIDPDALDNRDNWWSLVIEQLDQGLL